MPSECPPGSYGHADEVLSASSSGTPVRTAAAAACAPCPAGRYCPAYGLTLTAGSSGSTALQDCPTGYVCLSGARHPSDLDNSTISLCPAGSYCPETRAVGEGATICPVGTYQPSPGRTTCLPCPAGFECETTGTTVPVSCATGHYCPGPASTAALTAAQLAALRTTPVSNRVPCPAGTYGPSAYASSQAHCLACRPGSYCAGPVDGVGRSTVDGPCAAGYACVAGASGARPTAPGGGPATATVSGPCPPGHYCPAGTSHPIPCSPGTYQPATGSTACQPCPEGRYCPTAALSSLADLPRCSDGFFCMQGANHSMPTDGVTGQLCRVAHTCTGGLETACAAGTYGPGEGFTSCASCPAGYYCEAAASTPRPCPSGRYCPAGSAAGTPCPAGTYSPASTFGLESSDQCTPCPSGKYCLGGASEASG